MVKNTILLALFIPALLTALTQEEANTIGRLIWRNECNQSVDGLTCWNQGEEFPSLGIGHFIWYPKNYSGPFQETFPELLTFLESQGHKLPKWLQKQRSCPWLSKESFDKDFNSLDMRELRTFLQTTIPDQVRFIVQRMERALIHLKPVQKQFQRIANTPMGSYVLIDYIHFKGEGTNPKERYKGEGWGLLQVLEKMPQTSNQPIEDFVCTAKTVLKQRVENSPVDRHEERWLKGWYNRLDTYLGVNNETFN